MRNLWGGRRNKGTNRLTSRRVDSRHATSPPVPRARAEAQANASAAVVARCAHRYLAIPAPGAPHTDVGARGIRQARARVLAAARRLYDRRLARYGDAHDRGSRDHPLHEPLSRYAALHLAPARPEHLPR